MRSFLALVVLLGVLFGSPAANLVLHRLLGTHQVVYNPGQPEAYAAISGVAAPRPAWLPLPPKSSLVTAHQVIAGRPDGFGKLDLVTTLSLAEITAFYTRTLSDLGFHVADEGIGTLTPPAARFLGLAGTLLAERPHDHLEEYKWVAVQIRTEDGWLLKTRNLSVQWRRTKPEMPVHPAFTGR